MNCGEALGLIADNEIAPPYEREYKQRWKKLLKD